MMTPYIKWMASVVLGTALAVLGIVWVIGGWDLVLVFIVVMLGGKVG